MSARVLMRPPFGEGEAKEFEARPEILIPAMVAGWTQCEPPATQEVKTDVHD